MAPDAEHPYDTWGLSGPGLLAVYVVLIVLTYGVMLRAQWRIWRSSSPSRGHVTVNPQTSS